MTSESFDNTEKLVQYLEKYYGITVLSMRDYGSHAWNLDSESSDKDAGMVFRQEPLDYVKQGCYIQNVDRSFVVDGEEFEVMGWNIDRYGSLLADSNPSAIEFLNSGITYYELLATGKGQYSVEKVFEEMRSHVNESFKPIALWGHYRDMAKANFRKYIENRNDLTVKRHLYILRGLLYSKYVVETHEAPSLDFVEFCEENLHDLAPEMVAEYTEEFIRLKKNGEGSREIADEELWDWMRQEVNSEIDHSEHDVRGVETEKVNLFIEKVFN